MFLHSPNVPLPCKKETRDDSTREKSTEAIPAHRGMRQGLHRTRQCPDRAPRVRGLVHQGHDRSRPAGALTGRRSGALRAASASLPAAARQDRAASAPGSTASLGAAQGSTAARAKHGQRAADQPGARTEPCDLIN